MTGGGEQAVPAPLHGVRVLEIGTGIALAYCGWTLRATGAHVIKIEPPDGDWSRGFGPDAAADSALYTMLNAGKAIRGAGGDVEAELFDLVASADVVLLGSDADDLTAGLATQLDQAIERGLVLATFLPLGSVGTFAGRAATELELQALSGIARYLGRPIDEPLRIGADLASTLTGAFGYQAVVAALIERESSGRGQRVELAGLRSLMAQMSVMVAAIEEPDDWEGFHCLAAAYPPDTGARTQTGPLIIDPPRRSDEGWLEFCSALGAPELATDPRFDDVSKRSAHSRELRRVLREPIGRLTSDEVTAIFETAGGLVAPINDHAALLAHRQTEELGLLLPGVEIAQPGWWNLRLPWRVADWRQEALPAPGRLPTDTGTWPGAAAARAPVVPASPGAGGGPVGDPDGNPNIGVAGPLRGVTILDLSSAMAGPWAGTLLAHLGARVIAVGRPVPDRIQFNRPYLNGVSAAYLTVNMGKDSVVLDLKSAEDQAVALQMAARADAVIENYRPGVMDRLGLGYDAVRAVNPTIVYCSSSAYGEVGPLRDAGSVDTTAQGFSGFALLNGVPGSTEGEVVRYSTVMDFAVSVYLTQATLVGIYAARRSGRPQRIQTSQLECAVELQRTRLAEYLQTGQAVEPMGSGNTLFVPSRAFRARDGKYVAVSAQSDHDWMVLADLLVLPESFRNRFGTNSERLVHRGEIDEAIAEVLATKDAFWWEQLLVAHGLAGARIHDIEDLLSHSDYLASGYVNHVANPAGGQMGAGALPWRFDRTPVRARPTHIRGADTDALRAEFGRPVSR